MCQYAFRGPLAWMGKLPIEASGHSRSIAEYDLENPWVFRAQLLLMRINLSKMREVF
jgi:hypothetical protein